MKTEHVHLRNLLDRSTVVSRYTEPHLYRTVLPGDGIFQVKMTPLYRTRPRVRRWLYRMLERRNYPIESH